ncbi:T9SS type A sorting domain-containing protein [Winogradskyella sp. F6397]|uniref:T9SS type A sorting domain-containing protein n=1 Tax=Winogradskyella marina TaxID=2785530 RepID=A0ABS0EEU5_9FLAO|nr:T9SS sorting signal type C domain-containing protein [Winogradskyella marina]MBF8148963.1 T9SS type A sorting domain-containing protein [Winogradskyella marina]
MKTIIHTVFSFLMSKRLLTAFMLLFSVLSFSQAVVTEIIPRRVAENGVITVIGTGFTASHADSLDISGFSYDTFYVSPNEIKIEVQYHSGTPGNELNRTIGFGSDTSISFDSGVNGDISYVYHKTINLNNNHEYQVKEVYTNWDKGDSNGNGLYDDGFWRSDWFDSSDNETMPNANHDLLGFKMRYNGKDIVFSTGVQEDVLEANLTLFGIADINDPTEYISQEFRAYSTNGVSGNPHSGNFIATADLIDGFEDSRFYNENVTATVLDVIIDGENGLGMGTGITNFNQSAEIKFYSGNGNVGGLDDVPDLLITQIADPRGFDLYYYADVDGNVVGTPIKLGISNSDSNPKRLFEWRLDLYRMDLSRSYDLSTSAGGSFGHTETRPYRMVAFKLDDFGITSSNIGDIDVINVGAGGGSDMAFIAYNKAAFDIKAPIVEKAPLSRYICRFPMNSDLNFEALGGVEGGFTTDFEGLTPAEEADIISNEAINYQWYKGYSAIDTETSTDFTLLETLPQSFIEGVIYKVRISNTYGAIDVPFTVKDGGIPFTWDNSADSGAGDWVKPSIYSEFTIEDKDRNLVFSEDYNKDVDLVGCNCTVQPNKTVIIPSERTLTLYNEIIIEPAIAEIKDIDDVVVVPAVPQGTFTLEDDASLVQINHENVENKGPITVKRKADDLQKYDYVYWSSPVVNAPFTAIPGTLKFEWNTNEGVGNWVAPATSSMSTGRGYIARVPADGDYLATFKGVPNNGDIDFPVEKTSDSDGMDPEDTHWNLIGNPYPSSIDAEKFLTGNTNIEGAVYLWKHEGAPSSIHDDPFYGSFALNYGNQYIAYNATGSSNPPTDEIEVDEEYNDDLKIASGQGFFVKVTDDTVPVTFTNKMRYDEATLNGYNNSGFYRDSEDSSISIEKQLVWLNLSNETNLASTALIGYVDGATEGKDRLYDAYANSDGFNLYSLISEEEKMVIQGLPLPFVDTNIVPLGLELLQNGIYNIAIADVRGSLFEAQEQDIYLEDTYTGEVHDLRVAPYTFTGEAGIFNDRFVLRYTPSISLSIDEVSNTNTYAYINDAMLFVRSSNTIKSVEVYDINGKQIVSHMSNDNRDTFSTDFNFAKGVYIVAIKLDNGSIVTKKLIN